MASLQCPLQIEPKKAASASAAASFLGLEMPAIPDGEQVLGGDALRGGEGRAQTSGESVLRDRGRCPDARSRTRAFLVAVTAAINFDCERY